MNVIDMACFSVYIEHINQQKAPMSDVMSPDEMHVKSVAQGELYVWAVNEACGKDFAGTLEHEGVLYTFEGCWILPRGMVVDYCAAARYTEKK